MLFICVYMLVFQMCLYDVRICLYDIHMFCVHSFHTFDDVHMCLYYFSDVLSYDLLVCVYILFVYFHVFQMCVDMILKKCVDDLHVFKWFSYVFGMIVICCLYACHMSLYDVDMCVCLCFIWFSYVYMIVMCVYIFHFYEFQMCWYDFHVMLYYCHMFVYEWFSYVVYMLSIFFNKNKSCVF